jgi:hypothetical protein
LWDFWPLPSESNILSVRCSLSSEGSKR